MLLFRELQIFIFLCTKEPTCSAKPTLKTSEFFIPNTGAEINTALPITIAFAEKIKALGINDLAQIIDAHHSRVATGEEFRETLRRAGQ